MWPFKSTNLHKRFANFYCSFIQYIKSCLNQKLQIKKVKQKNGTCLNRKKTAVLSIWVLKKWCQKCDHFWFMNFNYHRISSILFFIQILLAVRWLWHQKYLCWHSVQTLSERENVLINTCKLIFNFHEFYCSRPTIVKIF